MGYSVVKFMVNVSDMLNSVNSHVGSVYVRNFVIVNVMRCRRSIVEYASDSVSQKMDSDSWRGAAVVRATAAVTTDAAVELTTELIIPSWAWGGEFCLREVRCGSWDSWILGLCVRGGVFCSKGGDGAVWRRWELCGRGGLRAGLKLRHRSRQALHVLDDARVGADGDPHSAQSRARSLTVTRHGISEGNCITKPNPMTRERAPWT